MTDGLRGSDAAPLGEQQRDGRGRSWKLKPTGLEMGLRQIFVSNKLSLFAMLMF